MKYVCIKHNEAVSKEYAQTYGFLAFLTTETEKITSWKFFQFWFIHFKYYIHTYMVYVHMYKLCRKITFTWNVFAPPFKRVKKLFRFALFSLIYWSIFRFFFIFLKASSFLYTFLLHLFICYIFVLIFSLFYYYFILFVYL